MPICTKTDLERPALSVEELEDHEEVFYCEITKEIFRDYGDYFRRIMLINSTVWACKYTGRDNLTYEEALKSESKAKKLINNFSKHLRGPVLLAVKKAKQSDHNTLTKLIYQLIKDRYFPGEIVIATVKKMKIFECKVLEVMVSKSAQADAESAADIQYKIQKLDSKDDPSIVPSSEIKRPKRFMTHDMLLYFIKNSTEISSSSGFLVPKVNLYKEYVTEAGINFESLFFGKLPKWRPSKVRKRLTGEVETEKNDKNKLKKVEKESAKKSEKHNIRNEKGKDREKKQETLSRYLVKKNGENAQEEKAKQEELERILKERLEKLRMEKEKSQAEIERKRLDRQEKIEKKWLQLSKKCDDLDREDQKPMPLFTPVHTIFPTKYFGDFVHIKEFMQSYSQIFVTNPFKDNKGFYKLNRAFTAREVVGPLSDILQLLMSTLFALQHEEDQECKAKYSEGSKKIPSNEITNAVMTQKFVLKHYSRSLIDLPVDAFTVSEVLRLHLLASGATPDPATEKWQFSFRNGYDSSQDPGLELVQKQPHILRALKLYAIYQLPFGDIIKVLNCLIHQIMTYSGPLNLIEERIEEVSKIQKKLRASRKKKQEPEVNKKAQKVTTPDEKRREKSAEKLNDLEANIFDLTRSVYLGSDRAYRNYYIFESLPGVFVEHLPETNDVCLENPPKNNYGIAHCPHNKKELKLLLLRLITQEENEKEKRKKTIKRNGEDNKENHAFFNNGELTKLTGSNTALPVNVEVKCEHPQLPTAYELYMCTGNPAHCIVHNARSPDRVRWSYIHSENVVDELINSLNPYGFRESALREQMVRFRPLINEYIKQCPVDGLSVTDETREKFDKKLLNRTQRKYKDANMGVEDGNINEVMYNVLVEEILELEASITAGFLGKMKIANVEQWRSDIRNNSFDAQNAKLVFGLDDQDFKDPGSDLGDTVEIESEESADDEISVHNSPELLRSVQNLAAALLQIEQAIDRRFLKDPFGITLDKNVAKDDERYEASRKRLKLWEMSLMASTSYSQVYLHKCILTAAIKWYKSGLKARCTICKRKGDGQNLLLCEDCNAGSHIYCLEPKLTSIPAEDWYCRNCAAKRKQVEESKEKKKRSPLKIMFKIEEEEEDEKDECDYGKELNKAVENDNSEADSSESDKTCYGCFEQDGEIICSTCSNWFHLDCVWLKRMPRGKWQCSSCKLKSRKRRPVESDKESIDSFESVRELKKKDKKRQRVELSENESEESEPKRPRRLVTLRGNTGRRGGRAGVEELPLNTTVLYTLLDEIMKHDDAWPFIRPVSQHELPDYYHVITRPMDFARIKSNLNMAHYKTNQELMKDIELVFSNCDVYNQQGNDIYNAGVSLEKFVAYKCKQLNLPFTPSDMLVGSTSD